MLILWSLIVVAIVGILPKNWKFSMCVERLFNYPYCRDRVIKWRKKRIEKDSIQLERLDPDFRLERAAERFGAAVKRVRAEGMDPRDPNNPRLWDFVGMPSLPPDWEEGLKKQSVKK